MAKKEGKLSFKSLFNELMEKSLRSLIFVVAEHSDHLASWIKNISGFRRRIRRLLTAVILVSAGLSVVGIGIGLYIAELYPNLDNGVSHILVGAVLVLIALLYMKSNE